MGRDKVTRSSSRRKPGFLEKLGSNTAGSFGGFALFLISFYVLYSNEIRSVETEAVLEEAQQMVISVSGLEDKDRTEGKLVHVTGPLESEVLGDPFYPVALPCVKLTRQVEMYQWVEHSEVHEYEERNEIKKETTYTYNAEWSFGLHRSRDFAEEFGHQNPTEMLVKNFEAVANEVKVNGFTLSDSTIKKINWQTNLETLPEPPETIDVELHEKYYYHARDPYSPDIGDIRVSFQCSGIGGETKAAPRDQITVIAKNVYGLLSPYKIRSNSLELVHRGSKSANEVILSEKRTNKAMTWGLRFAGWVLMYIGLSIMTNVIRLLFAWIPFVGRIISASITMFNVSLSVTLSLTTIAFGWLRARPLFSLAIAAISIVPWVISQRRANDLVSRKSR